MLVRNPQKVTLTDDGLEIVEGNVHNLEDIQSVLQDCQIVINTFGQPLKGKQTYSSVTKNILNIMNKLNIKRYIGVTGGSLTIKGDRKSLLNKLGAKLFDLFLSDMMDDKNKEWKVLTNSNLIDWTLIRLPFIKEKRETNRIKESLTDMPGSKITNHDIATFIINQINQKKYIHKAPFIAN